MEGGFWRTWRPQTWLGRQSFGSVVFCGKREQNRNLFLCVRLKEKKKTPGFIPSFPTLHQPETPKQEPKPNFGDPLKNPTEKHPLSQVFWVPKQKETPKRVSSLRATKALAIFRALSCSTSTRRSAAAFPACAAATTCDRRSRGRASGFPELPNLMV